VTRSQDERPQGRGRAVFQYDTVAGGAGAATLEVDGVRQYPGGRWLEIDARAVELTVPLGAAVAPSLEQLLGSTLRALKTPVAVTACRVRNVSDLRSLGLERVNQDQRLLRRTSGST